MKLDCEHEIPEHPPGYVGGSGYGVNVEGKKICYACCAEEDKQSLRDRKPISLYLVDSQASTGTPWRVQNWPGSLSLTPTRVKRGRHNWGVSRFDVWFCFENVWYHGVNLGDSQILRCKPIKK